MNLLAKLQNMIQFAKVLNSTADDKNFPVQTFTYDGKNKNAFVLFPYGFHANMSKEALSIMLAVEGDNSNRVAIGGFMKNRPTMAEGECCMYHPLTDAIIHFRASGDIDITSGDNGGSNINVNAKVVNVTAITSVAIDTPNVTMTGDLAVSGDITADNVEATTEVTAGAVTLTGHTHSYNPGPGSATPTSPGTG